MTDLWTTAAEETLGEITSRDLLRAKFAAAPYRHVVEGAKNSTDFENRLSFIDSDVRAVTGAYYDDIITEWKQVIARDLPKGGTCKHCGITGDNVVLDGMKGREPTWACKDTMNCVHRVEEQGRKSGSYEQERGAEDDALGYRGQAKPWEPDQYTQGPATDALKDGFAHYAVASSYDLYAFAPDGDYVRDSSGYASVDDAWEASDWGSKWFFYPVAVVVKDRTIAAAPEEFGFLENLTLDEAKAELAADPIQLFGLAHFAEKDRLTPTCPHCGQACSEKDYEGTGASNKGAFDVHRCPSCKKQFENYPYEASKKTAHKHDPIAYTYEADYHCPSCAIERFGKEPGYSWPPEDAKDSEGNGLGVVFPWDKSEWPEGMWCGDCHTMIIAPEEEDFDPDTHDAPNLNYDPLFF